MSYKTKSAKDRFFRRLHKKYPNGLPTDGCWLWSDKEDGYGGIRNDDGEVQSVHRFSWELHNGPIPENLVVMHLCNRQKCVNPSCLAIATQATNQRHKVLCGRSSKYADRKPRTPLSPSDKLAAVVLHKLDWSWYRIAKQLGRQPQHIKSVAERFQAKHQDELIVVLEQAVEQLQVAV